MDVHGGGSRAAGGRLCDHPQCLDPVAPDAVVHAQRQLVAVGVVGQPVEFERPTVARGWTADFVRQPGIVRRSTHRPG